MAAVGGGFSVVTTTMVSSIFGGRPERWESVTFWAVALLVGTAAAELVGITILF